MNNEFELQLTALLNKSQSKKQINADIKTLEKAVNSLKLVAVFSKAESKRELNAYIKQLSNQLSTIKLKGKLDEKSLKREIDKGLHNMTFQEIDALNVDGSKAKLKMQKVVADLKAYAEKTPVSVNVRLKKEKLSNDLTSFLNKNTKIRESSVLLSESERIRELIDSVDDNDKGALRNATDAFSLFRSEVTATGYATKSTTDKIKDMLSRFTKIGSFFGLASLAVNNFKKSLSTLKNNDTILTEISKAADLTKKQLAELGDEAFRVASRYGQLSGSYLLGVQEMSRAGYENADSMAELSTKVQGAGDMTAELANQYIIATDKAYKLNGSIGALTSTLDGANNITNHNAVNMTELAEGMSIVGSQAASAGMEVNETTAALSTMITVTQQGGSQMANAFKGILMNLQQVTGEVEDGGDAIDAESLTKYEKACNELGVSLSTVKDGVVSLREPMQIIRELSEAYVRLDETDARRANLLSAVGGKYRANALNAILENYGLYEKMLQDYADGLGSMDREAEKTAQSWEGRLNSLQNSFDSFVNELTNKEAILGGISFFDRLIQGAEGLTNAIGEIPVVLTALNSALVATNKDYGITQIWNKDERKIDLQGNIFGIDITNIKNMKKHFSEAKEAIARWNAELKTGNADINKFGEAVVQNNVQFKEYLSTCSIDAPASLDGYKAYLNAAGVSTDALRLKTVMLNAAISMGIGIAIQLAMKGVMLLVQKMDDLAHSSEHCKERVDELMSSYESALDKANSNAKTVEDLASRYEELSKGVNNLGQNVSLAADEYSEYNDIVNQIADMFPTMVQGYTNEGNAILSLKGNVEQLRDAYKEAQQEAYNMLIVSGEDSDGNDIIENYQNVRSNNNPFIKLDSSAKEYLEIIKTLHEAMLASEEEYDRMYNAMLGGGNKLTNDYNMSQAQLNEVKKTLKDIGFQADLTDEDKRNINASVKAYIQTYQAEVNSALKNVQTLANAYLMTNEDYAELDEQSKNAASIIVNSINENIASGFDDKIDVGEYVNEIIGLIKDNPEVRDSLVGLFSLDINNMPVNEARELIDIYIKSMAKEIGGDLLELKVRLGFDNTIDTAKRLQNSIRQITDDHGAADREEYSTLSEYTKEFTQAQAELWLEATCGAQNATEAIQMYEDAIVEATNASSHPLPISSTISQLNTQLKPAFDSLESAYNDIFTDDDEFALDSIDILSTCDSIKSKLDELNGIEGITVDYSSYEDFVRVLRDSESESDDVRLAFDSLATSITQAALKGTEDFETMKAALEDLGVVNNEIVAFDALASNAEMLDEALSQANVSMDDFIVNTEDGSVAATDAGRAFLEEKVGAENCAVALNILAFHKQLCNEQGMNTAEEVANLKTLAENAGYTGEVIQYLTELEQIYQEVASGTINPAVIGAKIVRAAQLQTLIQGAAAKIDYSPIEKSAAKAGSSAGKSYADALKDELSDLNNVINYISDTIGDQIDLFEDQKDAAVEALEAEKEAAEEALEAEKALVQEKIDAKQAEIDAIEDAAKARKNELDLQKARYDLERMQNQKTILQYSEEKGMHYVTDTKEIRDAKEKVTEAKENIQVANLEKDISGLNIIIDDLDKKIEESNEYYDKLIEETAKYWDSLIKGLEEYKSRWQELADIEEQAKMEAALRNLGITTEDVLDMSGSAFESFKGTYLGLLNEMYSGNDDMIGMLQKFGGISTDTLSPLSGTISDVADSLDKYTASTSNAGASTSEASESMGNLNASTAGLHENLSGVSGNLDSITNDGKLETFMSQANDAAMAVQSFSDALNGVPDVDLEKPIEQFNMLNDSVNGTTASISGGGASKADGRNGSAGKNVPGAQNMSNGGSDNLIGSIENLGETTTETLGEAGGDGTIGKFGELSGTIAEAEGHVTGIIDGLGNLDGMSAKCTITINIETVGGVPDLASGTAIGDTIDSMNLNSSKHKARYEGSANVEGTALVSGNWAVQTDEGSSLVGEKGYEIVVRNGRFFTVGDNGPEMFPIKKGDIVFNHEQSVELLKNGRTSGQGKAYADGTVGAGKYLTPEGHIYKEIQPGDHAWDMMKAFQPIVNRMLNGEEYIMNSAMFEHQKQMERLADTINNNSVINNIANNRPSVTIGNINVTCPGVTDKQVAEKLPYVLDDALDRKFNGLHNLADQYSRT